MARRLVLDGKKANQENVGKMAVLVTDDNLNTVEEARRLVREQFGKAWQELREGRLKVEERASARLVAQNLDALEKVDLGLANGYGEEVGLRDAAWSVISHGLKDATRTNPALVAAFLKVLFDHFREASTAKNAVGEVVYASLDEGIQRISGPLEMGTREGVEEVKFLECMLEQFRGGLFDDQGFAQVRLPINALIILTLK
jgi:hypothetical protein